MTEISLLILLIMINLAVVIFLVVQKNKKETPLTDRINNLEKSLLKIESGFREDFRINREENSSIAKENRTELNSTLKEFRQELADTLKEITTQ